MYAPGFCGYIPFLTSYMLISKHEDGKSIPSVASISKMTEMFSQGYRDNTETKFSENLEGVGRT
jgi:hypothetical protein